jgi:uncharacterized protein YjbI with pentapeptide repeats
MNTNELRELLGQQEGLKLDFKREYKLNETPPVGTERQMWIGFVKGQWDELIKDVLALTNGNIGTAKMEGRLIIGADDILSTDHPRQIYDTSGLQLTFQQIMAKVNSACNPPIPDIHLERISLNGKTLCIITIPPTYLIHETTRQLETTKGKFDDEGRLRFSKIDKPYTIRTVFIRRGEDIFPATDEERQALKVERDLLKQLNTLQDRQLEIALNWDRTTRMRYFDLSGRDLSECNFEDADFIEANLSRVNFSSAWLKAAKLRKTNLYQADLSNSNLIDADLRGADLRGVNFSGANMNGIKTDTETKIDPNLRIILDIINRRNQVQDLSGFDFCGVPLYSPDLSDCNLERANLSGVDFGHAANLSHCNLYRADLSFTRVRSGIGVRASLAKSNLADATFHGAALSGVSMQEANLSGADFSQAKLSYIDFRGADLTGARLAYAEVWPAIYNDETKWPADFDVSGSPIWHEDSFTEQQRENFTYRP